MTGTAVETTSQALGLLPVVRRGCTSIAAARLLDLLVNFGDVAGVSDTRAPARVLLKGRAKVGRTLTCVATVDDQQAHYRWLRAGRPIRGATRRTLKLRKADAGRRICSDRRPQRHRRPRPFKIDARSARRRVGYAAVRARRHALRHPNPLPAAVCAPRPARVGIYACGPTVYARVHVGNARPFIVFSQLKRFLEHEGYGVTLVGNITDINDKIYDARAGRGRPSAELAAEMARGLHRRTPIGSGSGRPDAEPLATEYVGQIIELIAATLIERGTRVRGRRRRLLPRAHASSPTASSRAATSTRWTRARASRAPT